LPSWSGGLSNLHYFGPWYEWDNLHFARRLLCRGDSVLDLGANVGLFSFACAQAVGPDGWIDSFEAHPDLAAVIRDNVTRNALEGVIHVHATAVSDTTGTLTFADRRDVSGRVATPDADSSEGTIEVPSVRLDEAVGDRPYVIGKLDIEGAELRALSGYRSQLERGNPSALIVEARDHMLRRLGATRAEVVALLNGLGYDICSYDADEQVLSEASEPSAADLIAVHRASRAMLEQRLRGEEVDPARA
jgi:FkbM family methyltransferase